MIDNGVIRLRPVRAGDWEMIESWAGEHDLWGPFQRVQPEHVSLLRAAFEKNGLVSRESALLLVEVLDGGQVVGFVRFALAPFPDADNPQPEIGFGVPDQVHRGRGHITAAVALLIDHLLSGYPIERIAAVTDIENAAARAVLLGNGFEEEGVMRRAYFRDGAWRDLVLYARLRQPQ